MISYSISGGLPVSGSIQCMGAKNLATKAIVASLLSNNTTTLYNIPSIGDVDITKELVESLGVTIRSSDKGILSINPSSISNYEASLPDSGSNRIPILLLGILIHRFSKVIVPIVGGDNIGKRNVDFHIAALKSFGTHIEHHKDYYVANIDKKIKGCHITLPYPSVGATETCIFLAVLAEGTSIINNAAIEPEIIELIAMLRSMGAIIFINANREIKVIGVKKLSGTKFKIIGDRIEAASWASLACASNGNISVSGIRIDLLGNFLSYYTLVGGGYHLINENTIEFFRKAKSLSPVNIETDVYPGFSTDWQQPFCALLTQANGMSVIHETVHDNRFGYINALNNLGAKIQCVSCCLGSINCRYRNQDYAHSAIIHGPTSLYATNKPIAVPDVRAGLAYLIAAALANGSTTLLNAEHIERGYGNLVYKLSNTNLKIEKHKIAKAESLIKAL